MIESDQPLHRVTTPREMAAQAALNRVKRILDDTFPSYLLVVEDMSIPFGVGVDRPGAWPAALANVMVQNPKLHHAVVCACLNASRMMIEAMREAQKGNGNAQEGSGQPGKYQGEG